MATGYSYLLICMLMVHNNYTGVLNRVTNILAAHVCKEHTCMRIRSEYAHGDICDAIEHACT